MRLKGLAKFIMAPAKTLMAIDRVALSLSSAMLHIDACDRSSLNLPHLSASFAGDGERVLFPIIAIE